jgi:GNAT superfamily N-acetyltransferase
MAVTVRRGGLPDVDPAADLWLRARRAALGAIPKPAHTDDEVRSWFNTHVARELELWVAESEHGELLGILVLAGEYVDQLYVDPTKTGRGIGCLLLDVAKRERPNGLELWTFVSNRGAQRFYERHGFVQIRRTDGTGNEACAGHSVRLPPRPRKPVASHTCPRRDFAWSVPHLHWSVCPPGG